MEVNDFIQYIEESLFPSGLGLSEFGKDEIKKRFKKSENEGGVSDYWKNTSLTEANLKRKR